MGLLRPCFARTQAWQQAVEYTAVLAGDLPRRNGWTIAQYVGDRAPNRTQRLLNRAVWDGEEAMGLVRRFVVEGLSVATGRRRRGLVVGALDETGQQNVCGDEVYGGCTQCGSSWSGTGRRTCCGWRARSCLSWATVHG